MEGNVRHLTEYLRGATKLIIPVYQRNYDWKIENCKRLMEDLIMLEDENKQTHFLGSMVVKPGNLSQEIIVIDGQQRLTTVSILLLALKNWMENHSKTGKRINPKNIEDTFLMDTFRSDVDKYKLIPNPRDFETYKKLFGDEKFFVRHSNLTLNYEYFYNVLDKETISLDSLMNSIEKLQVMIVNLNSPNDDPQLIFESLNSTGVDLKDGDKIRNYLLMNELPDAQVAYFKNYWEPIEERTNFDLSSFFRDYLTVKTYKYPNISKVYETFIEFYSFKYNDKMSFFDEASDYSLAYQQILTAETNNKEINSILIRFNELQSTVVRPFLMAVLYDYNRNELESFEVIDLFSILENYIARRMIAKIPSNSLNKVISTLYRDLKRLREDSNGEIAVKDLFSYQILTKTSTAKMPEDFTMIDHLRTNDFYNINPYFRTYFFERLENYGHTEDLQIYQGVRERKYSVEHIMPRRLTLAWQQELGVNHKKIHQKYLNQLGNLTLTGYNSKYSNKTFIEKQNMEKGFKESHFVNLNKVPAQADSWSEREILKRSDELIEMALNIWEYPQTEFVPRLHEDELIIFDGEQTFTGYKIRGYCFQNDEYQIVATWKEFFVQFMRELTEISSMPIIELMKGEGSNGLEGLFSGEPSTTNSEVISGVYVYIDLSNVRKMGYIKRLMELFNLDFSTLKIDAIKYSNKEENFEKDTEFVD
ncbi:DUF262 domain-containing protein [Listeria fleischmannii]|uniref:DUF262 domain-containing protein n=1 Tax=Listeria fleischmannii TaxID=1069827 RepID=UPI001628688B|nr:DUF262 domain-containing protein [Listeria fleischmannii]MBC1418137.1 DUF262 domain-containing protein [Listeria fleischmannii]